MLIDITTRPDDALIKPWLNTQENKHIAMGHVGTHLDTYKKSSIPLEYFRRRGVLIDVSSFAENRQVNLSDLKSADIRKGDFVIFKTNRSLKTYGTKEYFKDHPELSSDLIDYLISQKISFIGIDAPGIKRGSAHTKADILCEENGIYVIENLDGLDNIKKSEFIVYTMWLEDKNATGLKTRVICELV